MTVLIFIIVLAVLIFVHELGHFLSARMFGIRVDAFKIGFGPKLFAWKRGETEYGVNAVPFGGYVKIFGENPDTDSISGPDSARSFVNKPRWQQAIVLVAGVFFNFIFAWIVYAVVFCLGVTVSSVDFSQYKSHMSNDRIMVVNVMKNSPAEKVGLQAGDIISYVETVGMNASRARNATSSASMDALKTKQTIEDVQKVVNEFGDKPVAVEFIRDGNLNIIGVTPVAGLVDGKYAIGISMDNAAEMQLPIHLAIWESGKFTLIMMKETVIGLYHFFADIFTGKPDFSDVAGPIGIAGIVGNAANMGLVYLLMITAIISINLGIINLIPFPALDGGRILFVAIEGVIRRRIPPVFANYANLIGFALLILLMIVITIKDVTSLW